MRIYGGHDYYDCGLAMGIDPSIVLVRDKSRTVDVADEAGFSLLQSRLELVRLLGHRRGWVLQNIAVAFCGTLYRGVKVCDDSTHHSAEIEFLWTPEQVLRWVGRQPKDVHSIRVERTWGEWKFRSKKGYVYRAIDEVMMPQPVSEEVRRYMIDKRIAILVQKSEPYKRDEVLQINGSHLKEIGFAKALDPYTAFQELSMWIGGVLGGVSPEIVKITDDIVLAESHGYDKHSFRGPRI